MAAVFPMMFAVFLIIYIAILLLLGISVFVIWAVSRPPEKPAKDSQAETKE
jgi:uncharacterized membrane protein